MSTRKRQSRRLPGYETTREAGARLSVHADTVRRWCERKLILGAFKPPGMKHYRVPIDASKPDDAVPPLTVREAAARLKISENEVRDMCESGEVAGARRQPGGHWRMPFASAQAAAAARVALRLAAVEAAAAAQAAFRAVVRAGIIRRRKIA